MALSVLLFLACVASGISISHPTLLPLTFAHPPLTCDPTFPPACALGSRIICLEDPEYPIEEIRKAMATDYLLPKRHADIPLQSANDLVDSVTKEQEKSFNYNFYTGATTGKSPLDITHWSGPQGYICPSSVKYIKPKRAQNVEGHWRVIINEPKHYTQTIRWEKCLYPEMACRAMPACYESHCTQKFMYQRLLSFDPCNPHKGFFIDIYRLPSACSCHVSKH